MFNDHGGAMEKKKILIVDDEILILKSYKKHFETNGYIVRTAETAKKALEILKNEAFKVIFLDLMMPVIDGMALCREIRKELPESNIFAVTGFASEYELSACLNNGFDGYFRKPVLPKLLLEAADEVFAKGADATY